MNAEEARNLANSFDPLNLWMLSVEYYIRTEARQHGKFSTKLVLTKGGVFAGSETRRHVISELELKGFKVVDLTKDTAYPCLEVSW